MTPDFLIIGGMKCGTTTLHNFLALHPGIVRCDRKEPNFFSHHFDKGLEWYSTMFPDKEGLRFEASTAYTKYPFFDGVPERIASVAPDIKLIYLVRHPVKRIESHLHHNLINGRLTLKKLEDREAWDKERAGKGTWIRHYINISRYYFQLQQYLEHFDREQIYVIRFEDFISDPLKTAISVADFVGFDPDPLNEVQLHASNVSSKKIPIGGENVQKILIYLRNHGLLPQIPGVTVTKVERPQIALEDRKLLWNVVLPDLQQLEKYLGRSLDYKEPE